MLQSIWKRCILIFAHIYCLFSFKHRGILCVRALNKYTHLSSSSIRLILSTDFIKRCYLMISLYFELYIPFLHCFWCKESLAARSFSVLFFVHSKFSQFSINVAAVTLNSFVTSSGFDQGFTLCDFFKMPVSQVCESVHLRLISMVWIESYFPVHLCKV